MAKFKFAEGKGLTKIEVSFSKIMEKEKMEGVYYFDDDTIKEGWSCNNNYLDGSLFFSDEENLIPLKEFPERLKDKSWTHYIHEYYDNFAGRGISVDYEYDEYDNYEEGNTEDLEIDGEGVNPSITFYFEDEPIYFKNIGEEKYEFLGEVYTNDEIINFVTNLNKPI